MKAINIIGAFLVLVCNLVVSFHHSIDLFRAGGFGGLAIVAVVGVEVTFLLGALNLVVARMKRQPPGAPAVAGGLLGTGLVAWSNVAAGWEYGLVGILLGLATPASLLVAEGILSRAIIHKTPATSKHQPSESPAPKPKPPESPGPLPASDKTPVTSKPPATNGTTSGSPNTSEGPVASGSPGTNKSSEKKSPAKRKSTRKKSSAPLKVVGGDTEVERALKIALEIWEETGKEPGRPTIMKGAGVNDHTAKKVKALMKEKSA